MYVDKLDGRVDAAFFDKMSVEATAGLNHHAEAPPGPPMTRGSAAAAQVRLIVLCKARQHQVESDPAGGCEVRRRNVRARLALATGLFAVWEPAG
jgi:hypothetical protein